ncbi:MAG: hypothetical protein WC231_00445 [Dehalococcoidales bacterium]|jgi:hypothetical protein
MAKGTVIPDEVKTMIAHLYLEHPQWKTHEIRSALLKKIANRLAYAEPDWPGISAVQKELADLRKRNRARPLESQELDTSWNSLSLIRHPISPEALPIVLKLSVYTRENKKRALTIREALWASRYSAVVKEISELSIICGSMAMLEAVSEITNNQVDCIMSDLELYSMITGEKLTREKRKALLNVSETSDIQETAHSFVELFNNELD